MRQSFWAPLFSLVFLLLGGCQSAESLMRQANQGAPPQTGFQVREIQLDGRLVRYSLFIPYAYTPTRRWPALVFLHGLGESGTDGTKCMTVGLGPVIADRAADFPFVAIFPQSTWDWDENSQAAQDAHRILEQVKKDLAVDPDRVILTGISVGGYGTWALGAKYGEDYAALVPMCAMSDFKDIPQLTHKPIWCFHNLGDPIVWSGGSSEMCRRIKEAGGEVHYTEFGAVGHDCWHEAFKDSNLVSWMLNQSRVRLAEKP